MDVGGDPHAQEEVEDDPIPNELDNALVHLLPAIKACGSDPSLPTYLDLAKFEELAGPVLREGAVSEGGTGGGTGKDGGGKRSLDERVSGEIQVAFRHCMHEAGLALAGLDVGVAGGGKGGRRAAAGPGGAAALSGSEPMAEPMGILSLALAFVANEAGLDKSDGGGGDSWSINQVLTALPLLLLEDFMESQGRTACKEFWSAWVEPNSERLSRLVPLNNGRYPLIRLCNKLAQRMSKTHDSSLCGQMHMFLGKALDFFERSAVNVSGSINLDNVTRFEDEEQFRRAMMGFDGEDEASSGTGAAVAAAPAAKGGGDAMEVEVDAPAGAAAAAAAAGGGATKLKEGGNPQEFAVDYPLYRSFWRLQEYPLQQDKVVKGEETKATWEALLADVDKILGAFEANAFSEHDLRLAREKWAADGGGGGSGLSSPLSSAAAAAAAKGSAAGAAAAAAATSPGKRKRGGGRATGAAPAPAPAAREVAEGKSEEGGPVYFGLKYLTSSRLLRLQLRDPTLRLQVLTQWLILAASLKNKVANAKDSPNSVEDLKLRIELAKRLVKATPPRGEEYLSMLQIVLNRETFWTQWKDVNKCKLAMTAAKEEETQREKDKAAGVVARAPSYPNKRPRPSASVAAGERAKYSPLGAGFPLEKMVSKLRAGVPTSQEHLEDQRMCAEDPDTPASELPSASPLYTWRALRLLGRENPANLVGCYDGDLVKAMERLDKAQADAEAAAKAADEAAAAKVVEEAAAAKAAEEAAVAAAAVPTQPTKEEPCVDPPAAAEAAPAAEPVGGDSTAMAVDGEEEGRNVEVKKEAAAASTSGEAAVPAVAVSADAPGAADAAAKAASASTAADTTPAGDRADDTDGAVGGGAVVTSTAATDATASKASATPADAPTDPDGNGVAVTEGATATAAVEGSSGSVVSPPQEETPDGGGGGGSEKTNAVADSTAPATDAGKEALAEETPAAVTAAAAEKPAPSPARVTRRSSKK